MRGISFCSSRPSNSRRNDQASSEKNIKNTLLHPTFLHPIGNEIADNIGANDTYRQKRVKQVYTHKVLAFPAVWL